MTDVFIEDINQGIKSAIDKILDKIELTGPIIKSSKEVYIKVNGIDFKKHSYTYPEVLEAVIQYLKEKDAKIYVMEN
ncbi:MAG: hypothetical protein WBH31_12360 [Promethearchaeia archaeon]